MKNKKVVTAKGLDEVFNIQPLEPEEATELPVVIDINEEDETESDFDFIKRELRANVQVAKDALSRALAIQAEDEKARNTEVISDLLDSVNGCLSELGKINKIETELALKQGKNDPDDKGSGNTTNNILVTGNTSDILKQLAMGLKGSEK